jgi:dihydropteroate synthase
VSVYFRPLLHSGPAPEDHARLAGGKLWFTHAERLERGHAPRRVALRDIPAPVLTRLTQPRAPIAGLDMLRPQIMGILNVTPDSFSDGGKHNAPDQAVKAALRMVEEGASLIDIGGESTRPGADFIPPELEITRTAPVISALRGHSPVPVSIDTRKAAIAQAALGAGADLVNDVSGFTFDADLAPLCVQRQVPVCVMHAQGDPATMQDDPQYGDVLLDVYDFLATQIDRLTALGLDRSQIIVDPGIGFGKTQDHNIALLQGIALFHALGCPILLGVSRKRFIGTLGKEPRAEARAPGSIAVGLAALAQGVQFLRVHDVAETAQAVRLWQAVHP